jgi:NAD(P)-dependent dehydrogenase (short-subunit alcohol dehydrogenase family)
MLLADRDEKRLDDTLSAIQKVSSGSRAFVVDVTKQDSVDAGVSEAIDHAGSIDILVNNAGVSSMNRFTELSEEEWDLNFDVNIKGVWRVTKSVAPHMVSRRRGRIVATASMAAKLGAPLLAHYSASKFAVVGFIQAVAKELAEYGITANAVCPGFVKTEMQDREILWEAKLRGMDDPDAVRREYIDMTPLGRLCTPQDVANVVAFLCSEDAGFMTGQALNVTGGICVH